jgi:phosphodiesterase/alkaline phosphatase D-like protein
VRKLAARVIVLALAASAVPASIGTASASAVSCVRGSAPAPLSITDPASSVTGAGATLNGRVDPSGCPTTYNFEYGKTTSYGTSTTVGTAGSGTSYTPVSAAITGLAAHTTYHFRITATNAGGTTDGRDRTFTTSCPVPLVVTDPATSVSATAARLHGRVNPRGCSTTYRFQYGPTTAYGKQTTLHSAGSGKSFVSEAATVTGLAPHTTYHYRIIATNSGGTDNAQDGAFTTGCAAPLAVTEPASAVSAVGAILNGRVNPRGCSTTYRFEYGKTSRYGRATPVLSAGSGTDYATFAAGISGLTPHTTYHLRITAADSAGTTNGRDMTFTTPSRCTAGSGFGPVASTDPASAVSTSGATLNGHVDPNGCATSYQFQYGTSTAYGSVTPLQSAGSGTVSIAFATAIAGLAPDTTYHFRIVVSSAAGSNAGADVTFRTTCIAPLVVTDGASGVSVHGADLHGRVDPRACSSGYRFQFGRTTAYGHQTAVHTAGNGTTYLPVSVALGGLAPHTTYHYRIVAANAGAIVVGADRTFTTPALSAVHITSGRASVVRGFVARIHLGCFGSTGRCTGTVKLWHNHHVIGQRRFSIAQNSSGTIGVRLNGRGRTMMRQHSRRRVNVVASTPNNTGRRSVTLARTFKVE